MSGLTANQQGIVINLTLVLVTILLSVLAVATYIGWQKSTPSSHTVASAADQAAVATQLQSHLPKETYNELKRSIENYLSEDINYTAIRPGSYTTKDDTISFLADISGTSATYRFDIHDTESEVYITCPDRNEQRDTAWSCGITASGDDHEH